MGYYEDAKHTCPLCQSAVSIDVEYGAHQCTNAECHVQWWHVDIEATALPAERILGVTDGRQTLRIECVEGRVAQTTIAGEQEQRKPFQKRQPPRQTRVMVQSSLWSTDSDRLDKSLREAFSAWRVRNIV